MNIDKNKVGQRIKKIRQENGLTMESFGKLFNTSKNSVSNWEHARNLPNNTRLVEIAEFGKITLDELLYGNPHVRKSLDYEFSERLKKFVEKKNQVWKQEANLLIPSALSGLLTLGFGFKESRAQAIQDYETHQKRIKALKKFGEQYIYKNFNNYTYDIFLKDFSNGNPKLFEEYKEHEWEIFKEVLNNFWDAFDIPNENYYWINKRFTDQIFDDLNKISQKAVEENKENYYVNEIVQPFLDQVAQDFKEYVEENVDFDEDN